MKEGYIFINNSIFSTLFAISSEEQSRGLMHRQWPPPVMSFVYHKSGINKFWMQNTPSPLDIIFCHNGKVSEICYGKPFSTEIIGSNSLSDLVIELPFGTAERSNIKVGQEVGIVKPSIDELHSIIFKNHY